MRNILTLIFLVLPVLCSAQSWEDRRFFNKTGNGPQLRVLSSTDTAVFAPIIEDFVTANPDVSIEYLVTGTADINQIFRDDPAAFDLVVSSAMDLQLKLANDGFALQLQNVVRPDWAHWRQSVFAFTSEPAAIVVNRAAFKGNPTPQTRQSLIEALRARPEFFDGKVGTYDVRKSGLGYLFATQDARATETFWRLMEVFGSLNVQLYCCSGDMIEDLMNGKLMVAYNVLGSYAKARIENEETLEIVLPSDFPTTMMRTALVSKYSGHPAQAAAFIQHLTLPHQTKDKSKNLLPRLHDNDDSLSQVSIALEPALMTFLDGLKRKNFLTEWENAVIQN